MESIYHMGIFTFILLIGLMLAPVGIGLFILGYAFYYLFTATNTK